MAFIYFGNFLKRLFSFFVGFEPEMSIKEIKMLFGLFFFFFFQALPTYSPIYFSFTQSISYVHIRAYSLSAYCVQCFPQCTSMSQIDLCCSQGNKKINRTKWQYLLYAKLAVEN